MPIRVYSDASNTSQPQKENFYVFMAQVDEKASHALSPNYEAEQAVWMDIDTIRKMMLENPQQFRDAFRVSFDAINWDAVSDDGVQLASGQPHAK